MPDFIFSEDNTAGRLLQYLHMEVLKFCIIERMSVVDGLLQYGRKILREENTWCANLLPGRVSSEGD